MQTVKMEVMRDADPPLPWYMPFRLIFGDHNFAVATNKYLRVWYWRKPDV